MDDRNFDEKSALDWIAAIESEGASVRDQDIYPHLKKWIWDNDITNVVDLGCGQGVCSTVIPPDTLYTGIEPSHYLLNRAKHLYRFNNFLEGSAYKMPLASESVEGIFSIALWHLLSDAEKASRELSRVLRPNGHFLIITADPESSVWKKSHDKLYLRSETELTSVWAKYNLKATKIGAYRYFWFFEGRKV